MHIFLSLNVSSLSPTSLLFFLELCPHLSEGSLLYCSSMLATLGVTGVGDELVVMGLVVKKVFVVMKYIGIYETIDEFLETAFAIIPLSELKQMMETNEEAIDVVKELIERIEQIFTDADAVEQDANMPKIRELKRKLEEVFLQ
jgi:hypothetical protein